MKGFKTSTDYVLLWELIHSGYRIPAWILYSDEYKEPIYDLVEVKKAILTPYQIGTRGIGYEGRGDDVDGFIEICKGIELKFLIPSKDNNN